MVLDTVFLYNYTDVSEDGFKGCFKGNAIMIGQIFLKSMCNLWFIEKNKFKTIDDKNKTKYFNLLYYSSLSALLSSLIVYPIDVMCTQKAIIISADKGAKFTSEQRLLNLNKSKISLRYAGISMSLIESFVQGLFLVFFYKLFKANKVALKEDEKKNSLSYVHRKFIYSSAAALCASVLSYPFNTFTRYYQVFYNPSFLEFNSGNFIHLSLKEKLVLYQ